MCTAFHIENVLGGGNDINSSCNVAFEWDYHHVGNGIMNLKLLHNIYSSSKIAVISWCYLHVFSRSGPGFPSFSPCMQHWQYFMQYMLLICIMYFWNSRLPDHALRTSIFLCEILKSRGKYRELVLFFVKQISNVSLNACTVTYTCTCTVHVVHYKQKSNTAKSSTGASFNRQLTCTCNHWISTQNK